MFSRLAEVPLMVWLLWCGSLVLSVALIVVLRSRWGQSNPLRKCAVLSLLVHVMLAWVAMSVRIIHGDSGPDGGSGPMVHVRIVQDGPEGSPIPDVAEELDEQVADFAPPLLEAPPPEIETPKEEPEAKEEAVAEAAPPEPAASDPQPAAAVPEVAKADEAPVIVEDVKTDPVAATPAPAVVEAAPALTPAVETAAAIPPVVTKVVAKSPYALRVASNRLGVVQSGGGDANTEAAVTAALRWLATAQSPDGHWDANKYGAGKEENIDGQDRGGAGRNADTGITALALLAFLGAGHSHVEGEYRDTVHRGLDFLLRSQASNGNLFGNSTVFAQMYCHSMATFALAEAQAMTGDARLREAVTKAVNFSLSAQDSNGGGWRYRVGDSPGDTSQLGWQIMALSSAERAGVPVPSHTWIRVARFLRSVRRGNAGGLASYRPDSGPSTSMTAEALYCRLVLTEINMDAIDPATAREATNQLLASAPDPSRVNVYYWYYATLALHHRSELDDESAAAWKSWNDAMTKTLVQSQVSSGQDAGSWQTNSLWGGYGGRVFTTAMSAMCLEVYYRYTPIAREADRWTATRPESELSR